MSAKGKLTNKQAAAIGLYAMDNGQNKYKKDRVEKQKKNDNVKPH
ncbi:hypothetical protein [Clostridium sp. OS1-26]|nr:hypothetical protein [Clostridium sp. OS1-26]WML35740.1 hypothetical protein RCG18_03035 [Clostridium sp. OS1-26]